MRSNVDPHGVRLLACVHSRTTAGSWPKAAVILSLNPLLPCRPADQPRRQTGSAQHVVSEAVLLYDPRWLDVSHCFQVKYRMIIVNLNLSLIRTFFDICLKGALLQNIFILKSSYIGHKNFLNIVDFQRFFKKIGRVGNFNCLLVSKTMSQLPELEKTNSMNSAEFNF